MDTLSVPPPPASPDSGRQSVLFIALPLITVSWIVLFGIVVLAAFRIDRYEIAPGDAMEVAPELISPHHHRLVRSRIDLKLLMEFIS